MLVDNKTGKQIWEGEVMDITPLSKALLSVGIPSKDKETPAQLSQMSFAMMQDVSVRINEICIYAINCAITRCL